MDIQSLRILRLSSVWYASLFHFVLFYPRDSMMCPPSGNRFNCQVGNSDNLKI